MATRRPVVIGNTGSKQQLQANDYLPALLWPEAVILSSVTGGINSTADFTIASLTVPASFLTQAGISFLAEFYAAFTKSNGAMNIVPWVKVNGTKVASATLAQPNASQTASPLNFRAGITVQSLGGSGVISVSSMAFKNKTSAQMAGGSGTVVVNTASDVTLIVGANLSVADAGYSLTASYGKIGVM